MFTKGVEMPDILGGDQFVVEMFVVVVANTNFLLFRHWSVMYVL